MGKMKVEICMGSSCYSRGNSETVVILEELINKESLHQKVELEGRLCMKVCSEGPTIIIDGEKYKGIHPHCVTDLLRHHLKES